MRLLARSWILLGCLMQPALYAAEPNNWDRPMPVTSTVQTLRPALIDFRIADLVADGLRNAPNYTDTPRRESRFALAIGKAVRKGIVERAVEGYSEVLIQCQNEKSTVLTTPFMRSDSQQAHC